MVGFRVRVMGLGMVGNGDDVVRIDGVVGHRVASVAVGSEVGGRCVAKNNQNDFTSWHTGRMLVNVYYVVKIPAFRCHNPCN